MIHGIDTSVLIASEITSHSKHSLSRLLLHNLQHAGDQLALAPQVLAEFLHIVTDARRCSIPLDMAAALQRATQIWNATQVTQVFADASAASLLLDWMHKHKLGRKRLLDTLLAATYWSAGISSIVTLNRSDFETFGCFRIQEP